VSRTVGTRLREIRSASRFSISDVSGRTGISRAQISLIENDKVDPRLSTVIRLLSSFGADLSDLAITQEPSISLDEIRVRADLASRRLREVGLGPSDPEARLSLKASRHVDVAAERRALASRR
jgi:transcriptional regulator with XRE-family HTH domain